MAAGEIPVFPAPRDRSGLVMLGGELSPSWFLGAYAQGVFPWPIVEGPIEQLAWFSPDPRAILPLDALRISKRLRRRLRRDEFQFALNREFHQVVERCAAPRGDGGVWLSDSMQAAYHELHALGNAHSFEVWRRGELAAGVLGVSLRGLFSAESMFHSARDAGNAALVFMVDRLAACGFSLLDIQQASDHLRARGAIEIPRREYLRRLEIALGQTAVKLA